MSLLRSMSSGVTGLRAQQTAIDVIGNNIANATTVGFKTGRVDFTSLLSQTLRYGSSPDGASGGVNPMQVGMGVQAGSIRRNFSDGPQRVTGMVTDLALAGQGFFVLGDGRGGRAFSRDGSFSINSVGQLVDPSSGYRVQGYMADTDPTREITLPSGAGDFVINSSGNATRDITIPLGVLRIARETRNVSFGGNLNSGGAIADMGTILQSEPLFERVGGMLVPASETTLLQNIVRTADGTPNGVPIELGMSTGAVVTVRAQVGGRLVDRNFTVGGGAPDGGATLGELRNFFTGALGIWNSGMPGAEAYSSLRQHATTGESLEHTLSQQGERGFATLTLNGLTAGNALVVAGQTFTAGTDFAIGATDAETAANLATALNLNNVLAPQMIASVIAPAGGPAQIRLAMRVDGQPAVSIDTSGAPALSQTTAMVRIGASPTELMDGDTLTLTDGVNTFIFEFDSNASSTAGNFAVAIGATPSDTARNLASAIAASPLGASFGVSAFGAGVRITDDRIGGAALSSGAFIAGAVVTNPGALAIEAESAGVGATVGAGVSADSLMLGTVPYANGTLPASIRDDEIDFVAAGVQVGDFIRFTTGNMAGTIARVVAVGQRADGTADRNAITFEWESSIDRPPAISQNVSYFIHEAAGVDIGVQSLANPNMPPAGMDPSSPAGTLRISGNVGFDNRIADLSITVKGSQGTQKFSSFTELSSARGESFSTSVAVYDSLGNPHNVRLVFHYEARSTADPAFRFIAISESQVNTPGTPLNPVLGSGLLRFDTFGQLMESGSTTQLMLNLEDSGANTPVVFDMDFTRMSAFAAQGNANVSDVFMDSQDGYEAGTLIDFSINESGVVQGLFSNGLVRSLAQVAVARFANPEGLMTSGGNLFTQGVNSGEPSIGAAGQSGRGLIRSGYLEESNVELAEQFTNLITSQRAFQANARTISTASQLLQDLVNLA